MALSLVSRLRRRAHAWWVARLPRTDSWLLGQRNIYILPTRAGLTFGLTLVVMLLAAINYQLNLGFALTFLLAGAGLVSMHITHGTLRGLTLHLKPVARTFAGEPVLLEIVVANPGRQRYGLALRFEDPGLSPAAPSQPGARGDAAAPPPGTTWCDVAAGGQEVCRLSLVPPHRGWHEVPLLRVETVFPFGLFRAWSLWRPAARVLAWPQPEPAAPPLPQATPVPGSQATHRRDAGGEFDGVRPWRRGDTMRQVAWKKAARSNELVSRDTTSSARLELWLEWGGTGTADVELRLSRLTAWLLAAERAGLPSGLRLPGVEVAPGRPGGSAAGHDEALDLLAQWS